MNSVRAKNAIIIILVVTISVAIIAGAVCVAVDGNKNNGDREYFFDTAPIDYSTQENFTYANLFKKAVAEYLSPVSSQIDLSAFADRLLAAMSVTRIPAEKLGGMASAIRKNNLNDIVGNIDGDITDEKLEELLKISGLKVISDFLDGFFTESGLTGEEAGKFLYNYMELYSAENYKTALHVIGEDNFVKFVSTTTYFLTSVSDIKEGTGDYVNSTVLKAALYEAGSAYLDMGSKGTDVLEQVLGFNFYYDEDKTYSAEINGYAAAINGKLGCVIPLLGYVLREIKTYDIERARLYSQDGKDGDLIVSQAGFARSVKAGTEKFLLAYGDKIGAENLAELKSQLISLTKNLYSMQMVTAGIDPSKLAGEEMEEYFSASEKSFDTFFAAVEKLSDANLSDEIIDGMSEEERKELVSTAKNMWALEDESGTFVTAVTYMWAAQRLYEAEKELK